MVAVVAVMLTVQLAVVSDLPAWGAVGDLMLLLAIASASVTADANRGAVAGFAIGMAYDLMLGTPLGLSALVYALVGYGVGAVCGWFTDPPAWFHVLVAPVAGVVAVVTTVGVAMILGLFYPWADVGRIAAVVAIWNAVWVLPLRSLMRWASASNDADDFWMALP